MAEDRAGPQEAATGRLTTKPGKANSTAEPAKVAERTGVLSSTSPQRKLGGPSSPSHRDPFDELRVALRRLKGEGILAPLPTL